jgi:hypothetical protein
MQGTDLGRPAVTIDRGLLASVLRGDEVFLLDPRLASELRFTALEFRGAFPGPEKGHSAWASEAPNRPGKIGKIEKKKNGKQ